MVLIVRPQILLIAAIVIATFIYPFIVFTSIEKIGPASLSIQYLQLALVGSLCLIAAWQQSEFLLRFYPVAMNLVFSAFFFLSLRKEITLIEKFSQYFVKNPEPHQRKYMRGLTKAWGLLLLLNACLASYTACCSSLEVWTLYNGVISYEEDLSQQFNGDQWPVFNQVELIDGQVNLVLGIPENLSFFAGHFPEQAVLPGVVQIHWAGELGKLLFNIEGFAALKNVKFNSMVLPNSQIILHELLFSCSAFQPC